MNGLEKHSRVATHQFDFLQPQPGVGLVHHAGEDQMHLDKGGGGRGGGDRGEGEVVRVGCQGCM